MEPATGDEDGDCDSADDGLIVTGFADCIAFVVVGKGAELSTEEIVDDCNRSVDGDDSGPGADVDTILGLGETETVEADMLGILSRRDDGAGSILASAGGVVEAINVDVKAELLGSPDEDVEVRILLVVVTLLEPMILSEDWDLGLSASAVSF